MNKNLKWCIIFILLCALCFAVFSLHSIGKNGKTAVISQNGKVIKTIDLSNVKAPYEIKIAGDGDSYNIITVQNGKIAVTDSNCPDKICVHQGYIESGEMPIVCLPHRLTITIKAQSEYDAVVGGN